MNPNIPQPLETLVHRAAQLDAEIREKTEQLKEMKERLATAAEYKPGSKTGAILTDHYKVKVVQRTNEKWHQESLNGPIRQSLGDEKFFQLFRFEYKANQKELSGYLNHGPDEHKALLLAARTVEPGAPQVTIERLEAA